MLKKRLIGYRFWLSIGQLQHYFRFSGACFDCPWRMDNQNFKHWCQVKLVSLKLVKCTVFKVKLIKMFQGLGLPTSLCIFNMDPRKDISSHK